MGSITITFASGVRFGQSDSVQQTAAPHNVQGLISEQARMLTGPRTLAQMLALASTAALLSPVPVHQPS